MVDLNSMLENDYPKYENLNTSSDIRHSYKFRHGGFEHSCRALQISLNARPPIFVLRNPSHVYCMNRKQMVTSLAM